jgi:hypothetical protein
MQRVLPQSISVCQHPRVVKRQLVNRNAVLGSIAHAMLAGVAMAGCSSLVDPDPRTLEPPPMVCQPGAVVSCLCDDGLATHTQRCNAGGGYDRCNCVSIVPAAQGSAGQGANSGHGPQKQDKR